MEKNNQDRVTIGLTRKLPVESYGNVDIKVEFEGNSIKEVEGLVVKEFERLIRLVETGKIKIGGRK